MLYTLSGAPWEAFSKFPVPRATRVFEPTFQGKGILRSDDITEALPPSVLLPLRAGWQQLRAGRVPQG